MKLKSILLPSFIVVASLALRAQTPLPLKISGSSPEDAVTQNGTQIEKIILDQKTTVKVIQMPSAFGPSYTISMWVKFNDTPALREKGFSRTAPINIVDLHSPGTNEQNVLLRIMDGYFAITELRQPPSKWRTIGGIKIQPEPDKWYHLAYSCSPTLGIFCLNGDIIARTVSPAPQDKLQNIIFGRIKNTRKLDGVILQPRLYSEALTHKQIQDLYKAPPAEIR